MNFEQFFALATGRVPYGYQARLAAGGFPAVVQAPTGTGKTGIVLAWLWRRLYGPDQAGTPRRLIYALPQRSLVDQVALEVNGWLARLDLAGQVAVHVVMGGEGASQWQWRQDMHKPAIVIGTVDSLVSKALNRGYGIGRNTYSVDFALVTNGAHWVIDEIQLCPESTVTLRQLAVFARRFPTAEPFGLTCMSATVPASLLETVDNPVLSPEDILTIDPGERVGELAVRLDAARMVRRLDAEPGAYADIADQAKGLHRSGTLTLVVLNTVDAARKVYQRLAGGPVPCTLIHSRFRGHERGALAGQVTAAPGEAGHIVCATQVVEAGLDVNAALLVTEAAPWPSVVQRAGRCNRTGRVSDAQLLWVPPARHHPYPEADVAAAVSGLTALEGRAVTGEDLLGQGVPVSEPALAVLREPDFVELFDTAPDLSGGDLDVSPYVRDTDDLDAQLAWATWEPELADGKPAPDGRPSADAKVPTAEWRCRAPLGDVAALARRVPVWHLSQVRGRWTKVTGQDRARPGELLVVAAADGGYRPETGLDPAARSAVPDSPAMVGRSERAALPEETLRADQVRGTQRDWQSLAEHSERTRDQARALVKIIDPALPGGVAEAVVTAAYLHDVGKAHDVWQDALCALAEPGDQDRIASGRPWAKSGVDGRLRFAGDVPFRHELASLLLLDGPLSGLLDDVADRDLARYLVLSHHGKLRVQVRDPEQASSGSLLGLTSGSAWAVPPVLGQPGADLIIDLEQFGYGGPRSWTRAALGLRDRYGPFVLAYLETLVRVADWRASAGEACADDDN
jgi:CRISPR-associated endonuclease/helicase Cas3